MIKKLLQSIKKIYLFYRIIGFKATTKLVVEKILCKNNACSTPTLERRIEIIKTNCNVVLYIKNELDFMSFRYRALNMIEAMSNSSKYKCTFFTENELKYITKYLGNIKIIIIQRGSWSPTMSNFIAIAKNKKIPLGYDIDDLFYTSDLSVKYASELNLKDKNCIIHNIGCATAYNYIMKNCDFFVTTTQFLADKINKDFNKKVYLINNFLNNAQLKSSHKIRRKNKKFVIGYFSGTASHNQDFKTIEIALRTFLKKYKNSYLLIVGYLELPKSLSQFKKERRIIYLPYLQYDRLQSIISFVDVNVAPLVINDFNESKSELKFFEAGASAVPSCVSATRVYKNIMKHDIGFLCNNNGDWINALECLYKDKDRYEKISKSVYLYTIKNYSPELYKNKITIMYDDITNWYNVRK